MDRPDSVHNLLMPHGWSHPLITGPPPGPDVTETFCRDNNLQCVIRSHEARAAEVALVDGSTSGKQWLVVVDEGIGQGNGYTSYEEEEL